MVSVSNEEFDNLSKYIYRVSGISLEKNKKYLLETRLSPLLVSLGCSTFNDLHTKAKQDSSGELQKKIIDAISTNETYFFRDSSPFEVFKHKIIPELLDRRWQKNQENVNIRIWSAACSTGQEVYTIAISLFEILPDHKKVSFHVSGTDISDEAIAKASYGQYNQFEIGRGLAKPLLNKYFAPTANGYRIKDQIRSMVSFKKINLMEPFYGLGPFDIVFCRNVAIYFTLQDKVKLFQKIARVMTRDGYLLVGGSESLTGVAPQFTAQRYLGATFYQLKNGQGIEPQKEVQSQEREIKKFNSQQAKVQNNRVSKKTMPEPGKGPGKKPVKEPGQKRSLKHPDGHKAEKELVQIEQTEQVPDQQEISLPLKQDQSKLKKTLATSLEKQQTGSRLLEKISGQQKNSKKGITQATGEKKSSTSSLLSSIGKRSKDKKNKK